MIYKIGFVNGDVRFVADRDCDFSKMLSSNLKYALLRENTILLNMKNVAYIEKVGEEKEVDKDELS